MSYISKLEFDGLEVKQGGSIEAAWAKNHFIAFEFVCEMLYAPCHESFEIYIDGAKRYETDTMVFPGQRWPLPPTPRPVTIQLPNSDQYLTPGNHTISVKVVEHPIIGSPYPIQDYKFFVTIKKEKEQTTPYSYPPPATKSPFQQLSDIFGILPWWAWAGIGIVTVAYLTKPSPVKEMAELMKLKLMKELAEE
jgi:hypothetical protein